MFAPYLTAPGLFYVDLGASLLLLVVAGATIYKVRKGSNSYFAYFLLGFTCYFALVAFATSLSWALVFPVTTSEGKVIAYEQSYYATCLCSVLY